MVLGVAAVATVVASGCLRSSDPGVGILHIDGLEIALNERSNISTSFVMYNLGGATIHDLTLQFDVALYATAANAEDPAPSTPFVRDNPPLREEPLGVGESRIVHRTVNLTAAPIEWAYARQYIEIDYDYDPGGSNPDTTYLSKCFARTGEATGLCPEVYTMRYTGIDDPLPGSDYWRERIEAAGFEPPARRE